MALTQNLDGLMELSPFDARERLAEIQAACRAEGKDFNAVRLAGLGDYMAFKKVEGSTPTEACILFMNVDILDRIISEAFDQIPDAAISVEEIIQTQLV